MSSFRYALTVTVGLSPALFTTACGGNQLSNGTAACNAPVDASSPPAHFACGKLDPTCGHQPVAIASNLPQPTAVALSATRAFFTTLGSVASVPLTGGPVVTLAGGPVMMPSPLFAAVDPERVYWTQQDAPPAYGNYTGEVMSANLDGSSRMTLVTGVDEPYGIAVDGTSLFFTTHHAVQSCGLTGCGNSATTLATRDGPGPGDLVLDGTSVYWVEGFEGNVKSCRKTGCGNSPSLIHPSPGMKGRGTSSRGRPITTPIVGGPAPNAERRPSPPPGSA